MSVNPEWFAQQREQGVCYLCRRPMDDADLRFAHPACRRLINQGWRAAALRQMTDTDIQTLAARSYRPMGRRR